MDDPYQVGTIIAAFSVVGLLDFLVTYLAVGSAFAMRNYFLYRHRPILFLFRSVAFELVFWLPKWGFRSIRKLTRPAPVEMPKRLFAARREADPNVEALVESLHSTAGGKRVREVAEIYMALRAAYEAGERGPIPASQFDLFDIAGHRNGRAGTACLFRRNLKDLRDHSSRSADDLIRAVAESLTIDPGGASFFLSEFFRSCDDFDSLAKVGRTLAVQPWMEAFGDGPAASGSNLVVNTSKTFS